MIFSTFQFQLFCRRYREKRRYFADISRYINIFDYILRYIVIYHEMIYCDISYLRYIVKYFQKSTDIFKDISIYQTNWYITIYRHKREKCNIDISWYIFSSNISWFMIYFNIFRYIEKYHKNNFGSIKLEGNLRT